jgi:hypothetical protein
MNELVVKIIVRGVNLGDLDVPVAAIPNTMAPPSSMGDGMGRLVSAFTTVGAPGTNVAAV